MSLGNTILEAAAAADILMEGTCGGRGTSGKCRVRVLSGVAGYGVRIITRLPHVLLVKRGTKAV